MSEPDLAQLWMAIPEHTKSKLAGLTDKQRDFVLLVSVGTPQEDAYRRAYDRSPDTNPKTITAGASKVATSVGVKAALIAVRDGSTAVALLGTDTPLMTRQWVLERLSVEADDLKGNSGSTRVRALELIGRAQGMFEDVQVVKDERPQNMEEAREAFAGLLARVAPALLGDGSGGQEGEEATVQEEVVVGVLPDRLGEATD